MIPFGTINFHIFSEQVNSTIVLLGVEFNFTSYSYMEGENSIMISLDFLRVLVYNAAMLE